MPITYSKLTNSVPVAANVSRFIANVVTSRLKLTLHQYRDSLESLDAATSRPMTTPLTSDVNTVLHASFHYGIDANGVVHQYADPLAFDALGCTAVGARNLDSVQVALCMGYSGSAASTSAMTAKMFTALQAIALAHFTNKAVAAGVVVLSADYTGELAEWLSANTTILNDIMTAAKAAASLNPFWESAAVAPNYDALVDSAIAPVVYSWDKAADAAYTLPAANANGLTPDHIFVNNSAKDGGAKTLTISCNAVEAAGTTKINGATTATMVSAAGRAVTHLKRVGAQWVILYKTILDP